MSTDSMFRTAHLGEDLAARQWWQGMKDALLTLGLFHEPGRFAASPLVVRREVYDKVSRDLPRILGLARKVARAGRWCEAWARADQRELVRAYAAEEPAPAIARPDGIFQDGQLKLLELNMDSGLGGILEVDLFQRHLQRIVEAHGLPAVSVARAPSQALFAMLGEIRERIAVEQCRVVVLAYRHFKPYDMEQAHQFAEMITRTLPGTSAVAAFADELDVSAGWAVHKDRPVHLLWRYGAMTHPVEQTAPMTALLLQAAGTRTRVVSSPVDLGIDGKLVLAEMSRLADDGCALFDDEERQLLRDYLPWTRVVRPGSLTHASGVADAFDFLSRRRLDLVIKRAHSKSAQRVVIGEEVSQEDWDESLRSALDDEIAWVAQQNLRSPELAFQYFDASGRQYRRKERFMYNQFCFGAHTGAPLIRIERDAGHRRLAMSSTPAMGTTGVLVEDRA